MSTTPYCIQKLRFKEADIEKTEKKLADMRYHLGGYDDLIQKVEEACGNIFESELYLKEHVEAGYQRLKKQRDAIDALLKAIPQMTTD
jgi:hypothetical protein